MLLTRAVDDNLYGTAVQQPHINDKIAFFATDTRVKFCYSVKIAVDKSCVTAVIILL